MNGKINAKMIKSLTPPKTGNEVIWDDEISGFGVRITAAGVISFVMNYRIDGRQRRYTIGRFPEWSADAARGEAKDLAYKIDHDFDPLKEKEDKRGEPLMSQLAHDYMEEWALKDKRPSSVRNDRQMLERIVLPRLGRLRVSAVTSRDINSLHAALKATPYRANRVLSLLSKMFSLAIKRKWREDNPVHGIVRYPEEQRKTWLQTAQLRKLEQALREYPDQEAADAIRLLILTGSRTGEVLQAEWSHFDLKRGQWTKPSHHTKQRTTEHVPLNQAALAILVDMKTRSHGPFLFPGKKRGSRVTLRRPWVQVLRLAGLAQPCKLEGKRRMLIRYKPTIRIHDLRHTFASHLVSSGKPLHTVGRLLGHTSPQTTARYAHLSDKALRETTNSFGKVYRRLRK
jgi:integrase